MQKSATNGFRGWVDLFKAGTHRSHDKRVKQFSESDLDRIVEVNDRKREAPIVIGHPEVNAPAFGWLHRVRRVGDTLQGKFKQIVPEFEQARLGH